MDSSVLTRLVYRAPWPIGRRQSVVRPATEFDGCNISNSNVVGDKSQPVLNAAARVVTGTRKFNRGLGRILHDQLHWLDVPDRVLFKLVVTVHRCLKGRAPPYLSEHCIPVSSADTRRHLRSASRHLLAVPRFRLNTYGRRAFSVADTMAWNSLPDLSGIQRAVQTVLGVYLKRTCSRATSASSALGVLTIMRCTNPLTHFGDWYKTRGGARWD